MSKKKMSFEEALARIDEVIEALESKGVSLENSISLSPFSPLQNPKLLVETL